MQKKEYLSKNYLFKDLDESTIEQLSKSTTPVFLKKDETLFKFGETGDAMYMILKGKLKSFIKKDDGTEPITWHELTENDDIPVTFDDNRAGGKGHFVPTPQDALKHRK